MLQLKGEPTTDSVVKRFGDHRIHYFCTLLLPIAEISNVLNGEPMVMLLMVICYALFSEKSNDMIC